MSCNFYALNGLSILIGYKPGALVITVPWIAKIITPVYRQVAEHKQNDRGLTCPQG